MLNSIETNTVNQGLWSRVQDTGAAWTKAACDKIRNSDLTQKACNVWDRIRNIDLTNLKNHSLVKRAYNIGWKGPVAIIGVTLLGIGLVKVVKNFMSTLIIDKKFEI